MSIALHAKLIANGGDRPRVVMPVGQSVECFSLCNQQLVAYQLIAVLAKLDEGSGGGMSITQFAIECVRTIAFGLKGSLESGVIQFQRCLSGYAFHRSTDRGERRLNRIKIERGQRDLRDGDDSRRRSSGCTWR
ncbi:hypothetical protein PHYPSEUDO_011312 [Phytophthora pseudosyringae]|uniref:Uncharacterized protein n=1 Tax=Phytophthora pseudosyringae TaxID=221518 RepID=A0A8T1WAE8_9STRA|nr:hypothetical protein PHYPSEUDO_011312 [Phytophthora pseudosyringae]